VRGTSSVIVAARPESVSATCNGVGIEVSPPSSSWLGRPRTPYRVPPNQVRPRTCGVETTEQPTGVIIDPSVLFTEEALGWLRDPELSPWLVVSESLYRLVQAEDLEPVFDAYDVQASPELIGQIYEALEPIRRFSYEEPPVLPGDTGEVLDRIISSDDPLAGVIADEWVFLTTQSFGVILEKARTTLRRFVKAGAHVYEATAEEMEKCLDVVRDKLPPPVLNAMKTIGRSKAVKWVLIGGNVVGMVLHVVALPARIAGAVRQGIVIVAGDP
jgi:hypothetical protein